MLFNGSLQDQRDCDVHHNDAFWIIKAADVFYSYPIPTADCASKQESCIDISVCWLHLENHGTADTNNKPRQNVLYLYTFARLLHW